VCIEKFLKKQGLKTSRLSGFPCPFGKGKGSSVECKGKIEKSHPIVPKNEEKKKARMAPAMLEAMASKQSRAPNNNNNANIAAKAALPKAPRKMAPPKLHNLASVSRTHTTSGVSTGAWGLKGAAPVLANAHLPPPEDPDTSTAAAAAGGPRPAQLPVGLVLEEALTKAQKKNLARKKKRAGLTGAEAASEASSDHQDNVSALGASDSAGSSSFSSATTGAGLVGFDGASMASSQHDFLAQQGFKFVTDPARYAQLLGLYCADSDEEEDAEDDTEAEEATEEITGTEADLHGVDVAAVGDTNLAGFSSDVIPAPASVTFTAPMDSAAPPAAAPADLDKDVTEMEALNAAMAASIKQYQVEEEMRRQREVLASGFGAAGAFSKAPPAGYVPYPTTVLDAPTPVPMPVAAPVVTPVAVAAPSMLFHQMKQQPEAPSAGHGNGWVFGGGNQGAGALPPHILSGYAAPAAGYTQYDGLGAGNIVGSMAAGHSAPEVAADEDDDDLGTLLALCGVAG
jgi:hypothetical protein